MQTLPEIQRYLDQIPAINAGGCGVAALVLYRHLKQQGKRPKLALLYCADKDDDLESNARRIEKGNYTGLIVPAHICIIWKGQRIDSAGNDAHSTCNTDLEQFIDEDILIELLNTGRRWNSWFDRSYICKITNTLHIDLSDVEVDV